MNPNLPKQFQSGRHLLTQSGHTRKFLGRQYDGDKLVHYRGYQSDLNAVKRRAEFIAKGADNSRSEYNYVGSVDRAVIHDWLMKQGKTWHEFATDKDLKARFMVFYRTEYPKMMADSYQERRLTVNRTTMTRPKLGAQILHSYQKENAA